MSIIGGVASWGDPVVVLARHNDQGRDHHGLAQGGLLRRRGARQIPFGSSVCSRFPVALKYGVAATDQRIGWIIDG